MYKKSGFQLNRYIEKLKSDTSDVINSPTIKSVTEEIYQCLNRRRENVVKSIFNCRVYLTISYLFIKLMYAMVIILQLVILNLWFRDEYYPIKSFRDLLLGDHNWNLSQRFPRMALCNFEVYILHDTQTHWVRIYNNMKKIHYYSLIDFLN